MPPVSAAQEAQTVAERITILPGSVPWVLAGVPGARYHCCVTSPPYWGLRDYQGEPPDWPAVSYAPMAGLPSVEVAAQRCCLGLETTPEAFIGHLVLVFREVRRVLRDDATLWLNLGDSHNSGASGGLGGSTLGGGQSDQAKSNRNGRKVYGGLKPKDLVGIPWRAAMALQADGWYLRSEICWKKPNPMPESVTDRPTKAHEQVFLLAKAPRYFYDAEAVREPMVTGSNGSTFTKGKTFAAAQALSSVGQRERTDNPAGRNLRSVWTIATRPSRVSHFAVMAPALAERCIKAGTSEHGCCSACGAPWVRVVERAKVPDRPGRVQGRGEDRPAAAHGQDGRSGNRHSLATATTGWRPSCDCSREVVPCRVLDPFGGSGTTAAVAEVLGREGTICEPNESYRALVPARAAEVRASMERRAAKRKAPAAPPGQLGLWGSP